MVEYLKKSVDQPDLPEPSHNRGKHIKKAIRKGLEIGPDGRPIYGTDREARVGYKSRNFEGTAGPYNGYVGRIAVASSTVTCFGDLDRVKLDSR